MKEIINEKTSYAKEEKLEQKKMQEEFNSVTEKVKPENQNQTYNVRKEGIHPINQKR